VWPAVLADAGVPLDAAPSALRSGWEAVWLAVLADAGVGFFGFPFRALAGFAGRPLAGALPFAGRAFFGAPAFFRFAFAASVTWCPAPARAGSRP
jgi:hypothetical protein